MTRKSAKWLLAGVFFGAIGGACAMHLVATRPRPPRFSPQFQQSVRAFLSESRNWLDTRDTRRGAELPGLFCKIPPPSDTSETEETMYAYCADIHVAGFRLRASHDASDADNCWRLLLNTYQHADAYFRQNRTVGKQEALEGLEVE